MNINILSKFEYIVKVFLNEYSLETGKSKTDVFNGNNDLSILKIQKLLFFLSSKSEKLLDDFIFRALPYGPVNIDTYESYNNANNLNISVRNSIIKQDFLFDVSIDSNFEYVVDIALIKLKEENPILFKLGAFELVNISHKWLCWKNNKDNRNIMTKTEILSSITYYK